MIEKIWIITGGLGFIGKYVVKRLLSKNHYVVNIDFVNYASDRGVLAEFAALDRYRHIRSDIRDLRYLPEADFIVNFAAESHVDNSIADNVRFCKSNVLGVQNLLELTRTRGVGDQPVFIQISTDEVYGGIVEGKHSESDSLRPSNPYSATKAAADMLILGWNRTYGLKYQILRLSNNYGPHQYPEKLIPKSCWRLLRGQPALLHGDGSYIRSWLHVQDAVDAIMTIAEKGSVNQIYNVCGDDELKNVEVVMKIAAILGVPRDQAMTFVPDRVGQDVRYSMDDSRVRALGWCPRCAFDEFLPEIVKQVDFNRFL
jgi:dTDP-glucose 4,6-dehydratase